MICIRPAKISEAALLTKLAIKSEAYWGYDSGYMKKFEEIYEITEDLLCKFITFVLSENDEIIGFYSISINDKENSVEYFYIDPLKISKGYGKIMCKHMIHYCRQIGIKEIFLVTSPQAKTFYEKMGAIYVSEVESLLKESRMIPKLKFEI